MFERFADAWADFVGIFVTALPGIIIVTCVLVIATVADDNDPPEFDCGKTEAMVWVDGGDSAKCVSLHELGSYDG